MSLSQIEVVQEGLDGMHAMLDRAVPDMTAEQWNARPADKGVSAFFSLWHYVRTEDNIVNWVAQQQMTVWIDGGWDEHFGLHRTSQGTGDDEGAGPMLSCSPTLTHGCSISSRFGSRRADGSPRSVRRIWAMRS